MQFPPAHCATSWSITSDKSRAFTVTVHELAKCRLLGLRAHENRNLLPIGIAALARGACRISLLDSRRPVNAAGCGSEVVDGSMADGCTACFFACSIAFRYLFSGMDRNLLKFLPLVLKKLPMLCLLVRPDFIDRHTLRIGLVEGRIFGNLGSENRHSFALERRPEFLCFPLAVVLHAVKQHAEIGDAVLFQQVESEKKAIARGAFRHSGNNRKSQLSA